MRCDFFPHLLNFSLTLNTVNGLFRTLSICSRLLTSRKDQQCRSDANGTRKSSLRHYGSLLSRFNRTRNNNFLNKLQVDSGLFSSSWHTDNLLYECWKTTPGTTLLGWSKSSLLCCVFLPLIGPAPIPRLSVALLLLLGEPEDGQHIEGWGAGWLGDSGGADSGTSRGHNYQQICAHPLSRYWWVLWTGICYRVARAGAPSLTLLTFGAESGSKQARRRKTVCCFHTRTLAGCLHAHASNHTWMQTHRNGHPETHKCTQKFLHFERLSRFYNRKNVFCTKGRVSVDKIVSFYPCTFALLFTFCISVFIIHLMVYILLINVNMCYSLPWSRRNLPFFISPLALIELFLLSSAEGPEHFDDVIECCNWMVTVLQYCFLCCRR